MGEAQLRKAFVASGLRKSHALRRAYGMRKAPMRVAIDIVVREWHAKKRNHGRVVRGS